MAWLLRSPTNSHGKNVGSSAVAFRVGGLNGTSDRHPDAISAVSGAFKHNLFEAIELGSLPYRIGESFAFSQLHYRISTAEKIRNGPKIFDDDVILSEAELRELVNKKVSEITSNHSRTETDNEYDFLFDIVSNVNQILENGPMRAVDQSVLRQASVLTWNALEVLVRDIVEAALNEKPFLSGGAKTIVRS